MEFMNVKAFSETSKDLYEAVKEYSRNYNNERKGIKAFSEHSKEDMEKLINKAFAMEVAKQSGMAIRPKSSVTPKILWLSSLLTKFVT